MRGEACNRISPPPAGEMRGDFCGDKRDQKPPSGCRGDASGTMPALGDARCRAAPMGGTRGDAWVRTGTPSGATRGDALNRNAPPPSAGATGDFRGDSGATPPLHHARPRGAVGRPPRWACDAWGTCSSTQWTTRPLAEVEGRDDDVVLQPRVAADRGVGEPEAGEDDDFHAQQEQHQCNEPPCRTPPRQRRRFSIKQAGPPKQPRRGRRPAPRAPSPCR